MLEKLEKSPTKPERMLFNVIKYNLKVNKLIQKLHPAAAPSALWMETENHHRIDYDAFKYVKLWRSEWMNGKNSIKSLTFFDLMDFFFLPRKSRQLYLFYIQIYYIEFDL